MDPMVGGRVTVGLLLASLLSCLSCVSCVRPRPEAPGLPAAEPPREREGAAPGPRAPVVISPAAPPNAFQAGYATWYGQRFAGRMTSNGERFDPNKMTAAHRSLPFGTWVEVRRVDTGDTVRVRITDRGPWGHEERIIDLSRIAAQKLGIVKTGVARVELRVVRGP
jgi:rare lipoprotein A